MKYLLYELSYTKSQESNMYLLKMLGALYTIQSTNILVIIKISKSVYYLLNYPNDIRLKKWKAIASLKSNL